MPETDWAPRRIREAALREAEAESATAPEAVAPRFRRACLLDELGRPEEAQLAYLDVLRRAPSHAGALNNLGGLLHARGFRTAARTAYAEAVARHPDDPMGRVNLANLLMEEGFSEAARGHYAAALRLDPHHAEAHQGMALVLADLGDDEAAEAHRRAGFRGRALTVLPYRGTAAPIRLLVLASAMGGNAPVRDLPDDRTFLTSVLMAEFYDPGAALPAHDLVWNAIGDADLCASALASAAALLASTTAPVLNHPGRVAETGRRANAERLAGTPGVVAPRMAQLAREGFSGAAAPAELTRIGITYPLLLRTPGDHMGRHFLRVQAPEDLAAAAARLPGASLTAIEYLDARGPDGKARKYRVMMVGGRLYPLHLAVASDWKVHYFTAEMAERADYRAEEARFLQDMRGTIGGRAVAALKAIGDHLALDYAGVDFGLNAAGDLLLFEANATMVVSTPPPDPRWDHRRAAVRRIRAAVQDLLVARAARPGPARAG